MYAGARLCACSYANMHLFAWLCKSWKQDGVLLLGGREHTDDCVHFRAALLWQKATGGQMIFWHFHLSDDPLCRRRCECGRGEPTGNEKPVSRSLISKGVLTIDTPSRLQRPTELSISPPESRLNDKWSVEEQSADRGGGEGGGPSRTSPSP